MDEIGVWGQPAAADSAALEDEQQLVLLVVDVLRAVELRDADVVILARAAVQKLRRSAAAISRIRSQSH